MSRDYAGHCLCGRTRYRVAAAPLWRCYCHCESCRRATGAPVAGFPISAFAFAGEPPGTFQSSPGVTRTFCRHCGSPLTYQSDRRPTEIDILVASLDDPTDATLAPGFHVFDRERIPWVVFGDGLPHHAATAGGGSTAS